MKLNIDTADLKTIDETAAALKVYRTTIYRWLADSRLCGIRIGNRTLIPQTEIDRISKADTPLTKAMVDGEV